MNEENSPTKEALENNEVESGVQLDPATFGKLKRYLVLLSQIQLEEEAIELAMEKLLADAGVDTGKTYELTEHGLLRYVQP